MKTDSSDDIVMPVIIKTFLDMSFRYTHSSLSHLVLIIESDESKQ